MVPEQTFSYLFQICFFCNCNCTNSMKLENHNGRLFTIVWALKALRGGGGGGGYDSFSVNLGGGGKYGFFSRIFRKILRGPLGN